MVSVPDWSKFSQVLERKDRQHVSQSSRYSRQREEDAIRQAENNGYFLNLSKSLIEEQFAPEANSDEESEGEDDRPSVIKFLLGKLKHRNVDRVYLIKLPKAHIRCLGDIGICVNLSICILPGNFISSLDALINCRNLIKLDLHSNQITSLPKSSFWANLMFLKCLNLHDNPIGNIESLHSLAESPSLVALTLYDTPLSLKKNYRHHVVNSLWSLKALDNYVISDEEIIEDAHFKGRFAALSSVFFLDLCPPIPMDSTYLSEMAAVRALLNHIDYILAHNSPVIIIQRYYRGHLVRKHGARAYRKHENTVNRQSNKTPGMPTLPALEDSVKVPLHMVEGDEPVKIDFDSYMRSGRRPGSAAIIEAPVTAAVPWPEGTEEETKSEPQIIATHDEAGWLSKNLFINLNKLQGTMISLCAEAETVEKPSTENEPSTEKIAKVKKSPERKFRRIKDVKQFFGPVVQTDTESVSADNKELPLVKFRLRGFKQRVKYMDPMFDMIMSRRDTGHEVRLAEADYHKQADLASKPKLQKKKAQTNEQRFFSRTQGTMAMTSLRAVQQAYKERDKTEILASRVNNIASLREQRDLAKSRVKVFQQEKVTQVLKERAIERRQLLEVLDQQEQQRQEKQEARQERMSRSRNYNRQLRNELTFMSDFNNQNTSVSKALIKHDRQSKQEEVVTHKVELVSGYRESGKERQDILKKFMEHRTLMRQTETAITRVALDTKVLTEENNRLLEAKARVASIKARHYTSETFSFPSIHSPNPVLKLDHSAFRTKVST